MKESTEVKNYQRFRALSLYDEVIGPVNTFALSVVYQFEIRTFFDRHQSTICMAGAGFRVNLSE